MNGNRAWTGLVSLVVMVVMSVIATAPVRGGGWSHVPDPCERATACAGAAAADMYTFPNTPSTICQCMGCGMGAGYHAPMVFNPVPTWRCDHRGVLWQTAAAQPYWVHCPSCEMTTIAPATAPARSTPLHHHRHELTPTPRRQLFGPPDVNADAPQPTPAVQEPDSPSDAG